MGYCFSRLYSFSNWKISFEYTDCKTVALNQQQNNLGVKNNIKHLQLYSSFIISCLHKLVPFISLHAENIWVYGITRKTCCLWTNAMSFAVRHSQKLIAHFSRHPTVRSEFLRKSRTASAQSWTSLFTCVISEDCARVAQ